MGIYKLPKNQWTKDGRKYKYYWNEKDKNGKWKKSRLDRIKYVGRGYIGHWEIEE